MDIKSLRPAKDFAQMYGCKSIIFGAPGSAKTPLINNRYFTERKCALCNQLQPERGNL